MMSASWQLDGLEVGLELQVNRRLSRALANDRPERAGASLAQRRGQGWEVEGNSTAR